MDWEALASIAITGVVAAVPTWILGRTLGRRIARSHRLLAIIVTMLAMPALGVAAGTILFNIDVAAHPGSDWPAMQLLSALTLSAMALAVTIPVAAIATRPDARGD